VFVASEALEKNEKDRRERSFAAAANGASTPHLDEVNLKYGEFAAP